MDGDNVRSLKELVESVLRDDRYVPFLAVVKAARNGAVYGTKVRFPHALVMMFLFRSGTVRQKLLLVLRATRQHARNLATFAMIYKLGMIILRRLPPHLPCATDETEHSYDTFLAGLLGGYVVFGRRRTSVNQQIVIYVFARVVLSLAKLSVSHPRSPLLGGWGLRRVFGVKGLNEVERDLVKRSAWPVFAAVSWGAVMWLFRWHPESVQGSLKSSMKYIYVDSDHWDSLRTLLWHNK